VRKKSIQSRGKRSYDAEVNLKFWPGAFVVCFVTVSSATGEITINPWVAVRERAGSECERCNGDESDAHGRRSGQLEWCRQTKQWSARGRM
jgi:hypothetical protein